MPIYEYICEDCKHQFEALVRNSSSRPEDGCPKCHSGRLQRKLSTFLDAQARIYEYGYCGCPVRNCRRNHKKRAIDDRPYELTEVPTKAVPYKAAAALLFSQQSRYRAPALNVSVGALMRR